MSRKLLLLGVIVSGFACSLNHATPGWQDALPPGDTTPGDVPLDVAGDDGPALDVSDGDVAVEEDVTVVEEDVTVVEEDVTVVEEDVSTVDADVVVADDGPALDDGPAPDDGPPGCDASLTSCGGTCADLANDPANCGACGRSCGMRGLCAMGACACAPGYGNCDGSLANGCETDLTTATANCGRCGAACAARPNSVPACVRGTCTPTCNAGFGDCDGVETNGCEVNGLTDVNNCGGCGAVCQPRANSTPACSAGACTFTCSPGSGDCDRDPTNGCEVNGFTSPMNCGGCGMACAAATSCVAGSCVAGCTAGRILCSGFCVDTQADRNNCGGCGNACRTGQTCVAGACVCPAGQMLCGAACTNLQSDARNCGACGTVCPTGASCGGGVCRCPSGQTACGGRCVNLSGDDANCGRCGNACATSGSCIGGTCLCGGRGQACCWFARCGTGLSCTLFRGCQ